MGNGGDLVGVKLGHVIHQLTRFGVPEAYVAVMVATYYMISNCTMNDGDESRNREKEKQRETDPPSSVKQRSFTLE